MEKQLHEGHRARLRQSAKQDEELTSFSEFQVLEYFLSFIIPRKDTNPIAHALIEAFGSLYGVFQATEEELYSINGMTQNAACFIADFCLYLEKFNVLVLHLKSTYRDFRTQ